MESTTEKSTVGRVSELAPVLWRSQEIAERAGIRELPVIPILLIQRIELDDVL